MASSKLTVAENASECGDVEFRGNTALTTFMKYQSGLSWESKVQRRLQNPATLAYNFNCFHVAFPGNTRFRG